MSVGASGREWALLSAAKALSERGWFKPHSCADAATARDMAAMRKALKQYQPPKQPKGQAT